MSEWIEVLGTIAGFFIWTMWTQMEAKRANRKPVTSDGCTYTDSEIKQLKRLAAEGLILKRKLAECKRRLKENGNA